MMLVNSENGTLRLSKTLSLYRFTKDALGETCDGLMLHIDDATIIHYLYCFFRQLSILRFKIQKSVLIPVYNTKKRLLMQSLSGLAPLLRKRWYYVNLIRTSILFTSAYAETILFFSHTYLSFLYHKHIIIPRSPPLRFSRLHGPTRSNCGPHGHNIYPSPPVLLR